MAHLIVFLITWLSVFILMPLERILQLRNVMLTSVIWMIFIDNAASFLGLFYFEHSLLTVGRASLFQLLAYAAIGLLMMNWLEKAFITKLYAVLIVASVFALMQFTYVQFGAYRYGSYNMLASFIHNTAALSLYVWFSLVTTGRANVYSGNKVRLTVRSLFTSEW